jgi:hypothetical protein
VQIGKDDRFIVCFQLLQVFTKESRLLHQGISSRLFVCDLNLVLPIDRLHHFVKKFWRANRNFCRTKDNFYEKLADENCNFCRIGGPFSAFWQWHRN